MQRLNYRKISVELIPWLLFARCTSWSGSVKCVAQFWCLWVDSSCYLNWDTADYGGFKFIAYVLTILWHIYNSLINMRCYISFCIFKVCKTIVVVCICNGQLKICGPFIFDRTVLHLEIVFHMRTTTIVLQTLNMQKDM